VLHFMPDENSITLAAVQHGLAAYPRVRHVVLCETGFFATLPPAAAEYAIPQALRQQGVRRYGGFGLAHEWAWDRARQALGLGLGRLVSVFLGNQTSVAAVAGGRAVDTSMGFTGVEGIPSATSCGDIDPTIALQLRAAGMTLPEIGRLLSRESGFAALVGHPCGLAELLAAADAATAAARDVFRASVLKQIGAAIAVLGGVEALVFSAREPEPYADFVRDLSSTLGRLEVPWQGWQAGQAELPPQVQLLSYDRHGVMATLAAACHR
jgi:acetate kinase